MVKRLPSLYTAVTKMRSPTRTGEECPGGRTVFQTTFLLGPNSTGRFRLSDTPAEFGPRNCGQSSALNSVGKPRRAAANGRNLIMRPRIQTIQEIPNRVTSP